MVCGLEAPYIEKPENWINDVHIRRRDQNIGCWNEEWAAEKYAEKHKMERFR